MRVLPLVMLLVAGCGSVGVLVSTEGGDAGQVIARADGGETIEPGDDAGSNVSDGGVIAVADAGHDTWNFGAPIKTVVPLVWQYFQIEGTKCLNGQPAGFGASLNPSSKNLLIYFEGGGACFNDACDVTAFNIPFVPPPDGIFDRLNLLNPARDWNMIYVPYCTGDIHAGAREAQLLGQTRYFHGYLNVHKFLERWVPTFPNVDQVLVTGISAGGFGAGMNVVQITDAFGPKPRYTLIDDSGPPLSQAAMPPCLQKTFREVWGLDQTILKACGADCTRPDDFAQDWIAHIAKRFPNAHAGIFSNTEDTVIRAFMGFGWGNGQYNNCSGVPTPVPAKVYSDDLKKIASAYASRISTFYVGPLQFQAGFGQGHTVLRSPSFFTTIVDFKPVSQWVKDTIDGKVQHVGP